MLLKLQDPEKKKKSLVAEINNGRLAMMAIIGAWDPWGVDYGLTKKGRFVVERVVDAWDLWSVGGYMWRLYHVGRSSPQRSES